MWCQPISVVTSLLTGESLEVFYRKFPDLTWIPFLPNPVTPNFDICGLQEGNYEVRIKKIQASGEACKESTKTFTIGDVICTGIPPITFDLPNAQIGVAYNVSIPVSGTLPLSISGITAPAWMIVSVVGSNVILSGMPTGAITNDVVVEFTVDNCAETPLTFSDTIDVTAPVSGFSPVVTEVPNQTNPTCYRDIQIDFNVANNNFTFDITLTALIGADQQSYDSIYPPVNIPSIPNTITKQGAGNVAITKLKATVGGGDITGASGFSVDIVEYYLGVPTGNSWIGFQFVSLNNDIPC